MKVYYYRIALNLSRKYRSLITWIVILYRMEEWREEMATIKDIAEMAE